MPVKHNAFLDTVGDYPVEREYFQPLFGKLLKALEPFGVDGSTTDRPFDNAVFSVSPYWWGDCTCGLESQYEKEMANAIHVGECGYSSDDSSSRCSCGALDRIYKAYHDRYHKEDCKETSPNFVFKPTGYQMWWYKYPLRSTYADRELNHNELNAMVETCISSLTRETTP